jgi:hypothetical protein
MNAYNPATATMSPSDKAAAIIAAKDQLLTFLLAAYHWNYNLVWNDPHPDQVVTAMGTSAVDVFHATHYLIVLLNSTGAGLPTEFPNKPDGTAWDYVENLDGSISLT